MFFLLFLLFFCLFLHFSFKFLFLLFFLRNISAKHYDIIVPNRKLGDRFPLQRLNLRGQLPDSLVAMAQLAEGVATPRINLARFLNSNGKRTIDRKLTNINIRKIKIVHIKLLRFIENAKITLAPNK